MKDIYQMRNKGLLLFSVFTVVLLTSCGGSYHAATYGDDGIYGSDTPETKTVVVVEKPNSENSKYYEDYFGRTVTDYGEIVEDEVFTDVDSYSSQEVVEQDTEVARESYAAWEDAGDNVTINVYNTRPYYSYYRPYNYWNNYYYNDWAFCGLSWGWGSYYNNYGYYGYNYGYNYGYPYYYNNYGYYGRRNYGYINGPRGRGYASNYYSGRHSNRRSTLRNSRVTPRPTAPRSVTPRSTTRPRATTPRSTTPRSTTRPRPTAPRSVTPRSTTRPRPTAPRSVTPRSTTRPRATTPRSTPRSAPRRSSRATPRSSSRRGRV
jgi:hypothetical protein